MSVRQIRNESIRFRFQFIDRSRGSDVESAVVIFSPRQIRRLLGHGDCAEMISLGIPNPDALRAGDEEVSILVDLHAVGNALVFCAWLLAENASVSQRALRGNVVDANVLLRAVVDVELLAVGRKGESVRLGQILRK